MKNDLQLTPSGGTNCQRDPGSAEQDAAHVLALVTGGSTSTDAALEVLRLRLRAFGDPSAPAAVAELARHLPVLDALFAAFAAEATRARRASDRTQLLKGALAAQAAFGRTLALLQGLELQRQQAASVVVHGDEGA